MLTKSVKKPRYATGHDCSYSLIKQHAMKTHRGGGITPRIPNLSIGLRRVINFRLPAALPTRTVHLVLTAEKPGPFSKETNLVPCENRR